MTDNEFIKTVRTAKAQLRKAYETCTATVEQAQRDYLAATASGLQIGSIVRDPKVRPRRTYVVQAIEFREAPRWSNDQGTTYIMVRLRRVRQDDFELMGIASEYKKFESVRTWSILAPSKKS